jgi:hypothetical protein
MKLEPLFPFPYIFPSDNFSSDNYPEIRPWVIKAIAEEEQKSNDKIWKDEPSADFQYSERLRRIRFFRKHENENPLLKIIASRLELCERNNRCCSGACPECGRLLQRWLVRKSKCIIRDYIEKSGHQLVAITIIPATPITGPGKLHTLDIRNLLRRLKYALDKAGIDNAIGAIDFSFNEDKRGKYNTFWSAHYYIITSVANRRRITKLLRQIFGDDIRIPRPVKISNFDNIRRRRSYAFKIQFKRRIGVDAIKAMKDGNIRNCRNTSRDKLRAAERLELFIYLDRIGFAKRFIFRSVKPNIQSSKVELRAIRCMRRRIRPMR